MKKLDLYIMRKFLGTFFFSMLMILAIVVVFDVSEKMEKFLEHEATLNAIVFDYYKNFLPYFANAFSSLFTFVSVIFFTSKMASDTEIIAILSTGISFKRLMLPYLMAATVIASLSFLLGGYIIPKANVDRSEFEKQYLGKRYVNREQNIHRQIAPGTYIFMSSFSSATGTGYNFSLENFSGDTLLNKLTATRINWNKKDELWNIHNWKLREIDGYKEKYTVGTKLDTLLDFHPKEFTENPEKIKEQLTYPELNGYIERMEMRGSSNIIEFQLEKYKMFANAFATFILTIIGVSISSRKIRGGMGLHLGIGLTLSFSYILFMQFSTVFATNGSMNPMLAVWLPNMLFSVIAFFTYIMAPK